MSLPLGFVPPCLPTKALRSPTGELWLLEIKHDGPRVIARKRHSFRPPHGLARVLRLLGGNDRMLTAVMSPETFD